ncbi:MAG: hypothetical protein JOZ96_13670 [Acidobacteria bacterium]|nr:hypothetical protein [Acidobacteriota bacterium]
MNPIEAAFVNAFVWKNKRERALFELDSAAKRWRFLNRICHDYVGVFDERFMQPFPDLGHNPEGVVGHLRQLGAGKTCQVISSNDDVDGKHVALEEAVAATLGFGFPSVLICAPESLAFFEAEQVQGPPPRFLLLKK